MSVRNFVLLTPDGKGILGELDENGVVTFAVEAGEDSPIRGTELFNLMMRAFGPGAKVIHGSWNLGHLGKPSTNIDKVNELTRAGVPLEEAIQQTWTVTRARKLGFQRYQILGQPEGTPGVYTKIDVLIQKA